MDTTSPPRDLNIGRHELYQYYPDKQESLICLEATYAEVNQSSLWNTASEMVKERLRTDSAVVKATSDLQIANDRFDSGTPAPPQRLGGAAEGAAQNLFGAGAFGNAPPNTPFCKAHFDPDLPTLPDDYNRAAELAMGPLRSQNIQWVHNTRWIKDTEFLEMRHQACDVLKMLVAAPWDHLVKDVTPVDFLEAAVRHLVMGDERSAVQQAEKLQGKTTGVPLNSPIGFVPQAHPLLQCLHDIPTFLEAPRRHFDALKALSVATEYKMRPHRFLKIVMRFVGPPLKDVHGRYLREIRSFTFEDLKP
jgi:hypothetical protein